MRTELGFPPLRADPPGDRSDWRALLFLHIPKTAGSTLQHVLYRQYGSEHVSPVRTYDAAEVEEIVRRVERGDPSPPPVDPNERSAPEIVRRSRDELMQLRVVYGHFWYGLHERIEHPATYFTTLRDPVDRVVSRYHFLRSHLGLSVSLERYLALRHDAEIDNAQTRRLCGRLAGVDVRFAPCTDEMLERAKRHLRERFAAVGIFERFDESFVLMARTFGWQYASYVVQNVNRTRPRVSDLPEAIRAHIAARNRYDRDLYAFAESLFEEQLARANVDGTSVRRLRRINFFFRLAREHPRIGPPIVAGARVAGRAVRPFRRTRATDRGAV